MALERKFAKFRIFRNVCECHNFGANFAKVRRRKFSLQTPTDRGQNDGKTVGIAGPVYLADDALLAPVDVLTLLAAVLHGHVLAVLLHHRLALLHGVVATHLHSAYRWESYSTRTRAKS